MLNTNYGLAKAPNLATSTPTRSTVIFWHTSSVFFVAFHPPPPLPVPSNQQNSNVLHILYLKVSAQTERPVLHNVELPAVVTRLCRFFVRLSLQAMKGHHAFSSENLPNIFPPLFMPLLVIFGASAVPIVHPDMFWYQVPRETSKHPVAPSKWARGPSINVQKSLRESQTARSSDTECPADSDACYMSKAGGDERPRGPQREEERGGTRGSGQLRTSCQIHWDLKRAQQTAAPWASLQSRYQTTTMERFTRWSNAMWFCFQMTGRQTEWIKRERARLLLVGGECLCVWTSTVCWHAVRLHISE